MPYYLLDAARNPIEVSLSVWLKRAMKTSSISESIACHLLGYFAISTIFIGIAIPTFETAVFNKKTHLSEIQRYTSYGEALQGHNSILNTVLLHPDVHAHYILENIIMSKKKPLLLVSKVYCNK